MLQTKSAQNSFRSGTICFYRDLVMHLFRTVSDASDTSAFHDWRRYHDTALVYKALQYGVSF